MKSFWKKHWKWLVPTLAAAAALIVAVSLYFLGFRITYDPTIITNWDAVSGCASWVGVFVSVIAAIASIVAIVYAIRVPKEIANRQDQIALFEKRYTCYSEMVKMLKCVNRLATMDTNEDIVLCFKFWLFQDEKVYNQVSNEEIELKLARVNELALSGRFLFLGYDSVLADRVMDTARKLFLSCSLIVPHKDGTPLWQEQIVYRDELVNQCNQFKVKNIPLMESVIDLRMKKEA